MKCRILYYANSTSTFQLELCGDVEINPGPTKTETEPTHPSNSNVSKPISYSRTELLQLNKYNHQTAPKLPCELWTHLQNLGITYRCRLPRRKRGGRRKPRSLNDKHDPLKISSESVPTFQKLPVCNANPPADQDTTNHDAASVNLCVLNPRSVRNKTHVLCDYIVDNDLDVFAITESWLSDDSNKHKKTIGHLTLPGYDLFHVPRPNRRGGGVAVIHKQTIARSTSSQFKYV